MSLEVCPMTLKEANAFVEQHHRHHKPVVGHKFSIGCTDGKEIVGVAIVGRPVSRHLDDGWTLEVNRLCTDGTHNACSMLYAAAWRAARAMGLQTTCDLHTGQRKWHKPESQRLEMRGTGWRLAVDRKAQTGG